MTQPEAPRADRLNGAVSGISIRLGDEVVIELNSRGGDQAMLDRPVKNTMGMIEVATLAEYATSIARHAQRGRLPRPAVAPLPGEIRLQFCDHRQNPVGSGLAALSRRNRIHLRARHARDQACAPLEGHVTPEPAQCDRESVAKAD
jgi:hypothetical protein